MYWMTTATTSRVEGRRAWGQINNRNTDKTLPYRGMDEEVQTNCFEWKKTFVVGSVTDIVMVRF